MIPKKIYASKMSFIKYLFLINIFVLTFGNVKAQISHSTACNSLDGWDNSYFGVTSLHSCSGSSFYDNLWSSVPTANTYKNVGSSNGNQVTITFDFKAKDYSGGGVTSTSSYDIYLDYSTNGSSWTNAVATMSKHSSSGCASKTMTHTPTSGTTYYRFRGVRYSGDFYPIFDNISIQQVTGPSIAYSSASYCSSASDPSPTLSGNAGSGTYSSAAGLSINSSTGAIDISASTIGSYTITYTDTDAQTATFNLTISTGAVYVSTTGSDSNNGLTTGTAFATIQKAIDEANSSCGAVTIYVADGTYNENDIDIDLSVTIIGESESGTIIDNNDVSGEYCFEVTTDDADVTIKNITIRDFKGDAGCAFRSYRHDNKVVFDAVTVNSCYILSSATYDAAVFIYHNTSATTSDSVVMKNCTFSDNYSAQSSYGTALYVGSYNYDYDYSVLITNCVFDNNDSDGSTGSYGACNIERGYSAEVTKCIFKNNTGHGYNSGLRLKSIGNLSGTAGRVIVENCLFHDNSLSFAGAAMGFNYAKGSLTNCTFAQNSNTNTSDYYVSNLDLSNSTITVKNSIFQSDDSGNEMISGGTLSYCIINGGSGGDTYTDGGNNLSSDPSFTNAGSNDFTLSSASPCIDAGSSSGAPSDDIAGTTRDATPDIGCYESPRNLWTGAVSTAWTNTGNWSLGTIPISSDAIAISNVTNQPGITTNVTLAGLTIDAGADITITSNSLTVNGAFDLNGTMNIANATVNADGAFDATGGAIDFTHASGSLVLSSTVVSLGTLDAAIGTVEYDAAGVQNILADSYYNLSISAAGTKTVKGEINVNGDLVTAATAGCKLDMSIYDLHLAGDFTVGATDGLDLSDAAALLTFDGSSDQTVSHEGSAAGSSTVTLVSEDFTSISTGFLTESVSTSATYQNVANCAIEKWDIVSSNGSSAGSCSGCSGNRAYIEYYGSSCTQDNTIITAEFSPTTSALDISFNYAVRDYGGQYFEVYLYNVTDATQVGTDLINITSSVNNQTYSAQTTLSGSNSTSDTYSLRFHYYGNNDYGAQFDNVLIQEDVTTSGAELNNCTINNSGGNIILNDEITVDGTITFTSGDIDASSNTLTLTSSATVSGASSAAHVIGTIVKTTASTAKFTFPAGDGTQYKSIAITPSSSSSTNWTAKYFNTSYSTTTLDGNNGGDLHHVSTAEYWDLARSGSADAIVEIAWVPANAVLEYTDLRIAHCDGTDWDMIAANCYGNNNSGVISSGSAVTSFSPFTLGSSSSTNVLPVELVAFYGDKKENENILNWATASEINNSYFTIEKSYNGIEFEFVGMQDGTSPSTQIVNYSLTDYNILKTINYYRLKQTDYDGKFEYSNTISIDNRIDDSSKEIIGRTNLLGQEVDEYYSGIVIVLYKNGTCEKFYQLK